MTTPISGEWQEDDYSTNLIPPDNAWSGETGVIQPEQVAVPVHIVGEPKRDSPEYCAFSTVTIQQAGTITAPPYCTQLLQRRYQRYKAKFFNIVFNTGATAVIFNSKPDALTGANPQGAQITVATNTLPDYDAEQPLYAVGIGGTVTISYFDESFGFKKVE
jgi:hypothetical protein